MSNKASNLMEPDKMELKTLQGQPASLLGLAGQPQMDSSCVPLAYEAGVNFFFFYNLSFKSLLTELRRLLAIGREQLMVATGSSHRSLRKLRQYRDEVRRYLNTDVVDVFLAEYVSPADEMAQVLCVLDELHGWKEQGLVRYVGGTVHSRPLALELIEGGQCEVLMHRYNMAHRGAEKKVFPAAWRARIPIIAFTCTRWGSLLKGHPDWPVEVPQAADCYRYALQHRVVHLALTAPKTRTQLKENLRVLSAPPLTPSEEVRWQQYGDLIYGNGQDAFETSWP
ncbi:MAG: aldo/keto reductase [Xenococcaceae cyanobacterium]